MSGWVRLWLDMPTDPKWRAIARKSGQPLPCVIALFNLLLVNAGGNTDDRGALRNWDSEDAAAALDMDSDDVASIIDAMEGKVLDSGRLTGWEKRQPKREDNSAERVKAHRERMATQAKGAVTQCNAPEIDTEIDTEIEKKKEKEPRKRVAVVDLPDWIPVLEWNGWLEMRKAKRSAASSRAQSLAIDKLEALRSQGHDPGAVLDQSTLKGWTDLYPIKESENHGKQFTHSDGKSVGRTQAAAMAVLARLEGKRDAGATANNPAISGPSGGGTHPRLTG